MNKKVFRLALNVIEILLVILWFYFEKISLSKYEMTVVTVLLAVLSIDLISRFIEKKS